MALEESGVSLAIEGLAAFKAGMDESRGLIDGIGNAALSVGTGAMGVLGDTISGVADIVSGAFSAALGIGVAGLAAFTSGIVAGAFEAEESELKLNRLSRVITNMGDSTDITIDQVTSLAEEFAHLAGGSDDAIIAIEELAIKSQAISSEQLPDFIQQSLDLGAVMGDNTTAARLLARAYKEPSSILPALRKQGILYTEEQQEQIKTLEAAGDTAGALAIVQQQLANITGGAALENAQTLKGAWELFTGTIAEGFEEIGSNFLPLFKVLSTAIIDAVPFISELATAFSSFFGVLMSGSTDIADTFDSFSSMLNDVLPGAGTAVNEFIYSIEDFLEFFQANMPAIQEMGATVFGSLQEIVSSLAAVWTESLQPAISSTFETIFGEAPTAQETLDNLLSGISEGAQIAAAWVEGTLVPAIQNFSVWLKDDFAPVAKDVLDWLAVNIPVAIQAASDFWTGTLQPALNTIWSFIVNNVIPAISDVVTWLAANLPTAIQTASDFWNNVLYPALNAIWDFINTSVIPIISDLVVWLQTNVPVATQALSDLWTGTLLPTLNTIWSFINTSVIPIFTALGAIIAEVARITGEVMVLVWNTALQPALETVGGFIQGTINPALAEIGRLITEVVSPTVDNLTNETLIPLGTAFGTLSDTAEGLVSFLWSIVDALKAIKIPEDLTPGSPTPFEMGLRGITSAIADLNSEMKPLQSVWDNMASQPVVAGRGAAPPIAGLPGRDRHAPITEDNRTINIYPNYSKYQEPPEILWDFTLANA